MEQIHHMEQVMRDLRKWPIFRQLIPQEAGIGWPMPVRKAKNVYVTFAFFGMVSQKDVQQTSLFPPFATLTINWQNQVPVEYVSLRFRNPWPEGNWEEQAGIFPHPAVVHLSVGQYEQKREKLLAMYDDMLVTLAQGSIFAPEWKVTFGDLLRTLIEPGLEPFYRVLAPKFFDHFLPRESDRHVS